MTLTEIRTALKANAAARAKNAADLADARPASVFYQRQMDRKWDLEAINAMLCRIYDREAGA